MLRARHDAATAGTRKMVKYEADYLFYKPS